MNFEKYASTANAFVHDLSIELGAPEDRARAGRILRCVLHALRRRLTPAESFDLIAQLPMFIKAVYVDGWRIVDSPDRSIRTPATFASAIYTQDQRAATSDFGSPQAALEAARAVFRVMRRHVSAGESNDVAAQLPKSIRPLWTDA
jgi:uncharacterized protein (DUF2267 family)